MEEWGKVLLRAAVILLALYYFCWPVRLSGNSMEPSFADGDIVLMSRAMALAGRYERGDIVIFRYEDMGEEMTLVKRVTALPGEHIRILAEGKGVEIDGTPLPEPYTQGWTDGIADITIPEKSLFLMGDNRETSYDSRNIGPVSQNDIKGKAFFRVYPFRAFGGI